MSAIIGQFRKIVAVTALSLGAAMPASAQSLADTMVAAYRNSPLMEQNRAVLRAADEDVAQAISALRPVIGWVSQYTHSKGGAESMSFGLQADMTLYDFGRSALAIDSTKETVLATRQSLVGIEQDVIYESTGGQVSVQYSGQPVPRPGSLHSLQLLPL